MARPLIECVPNISEGRDKAKIEAIARVAETVEGVRLLDVDPGATTNRTVITFVGEPDAVIEAAFRLVNARLRSANEQQTLEGTYREQLAIYEKDYEGATALLSVGQAKRIEKLPLPEHAALTITCLGILILDQSLTRE